MLFNSLSFILLFLPAALLGFYALARIGNRWAAGWLVAASLLFYTWWKASLIFILLGSISFNFCCGALILHFQGREKLGQGLLWCGVGGNLFLLFYYKYFFVLLNGLGFHGLIPLSHPYEIVLPLGISFFTFTQIGYLVDCKGGVVKSNRLLDYCLFVTFFPHLIAGPILHHREMMPQFADPQTYRFKWRNMAVGLALFVIGLTKKVVIADYFISIVSNIFENAHAPSFFPAWDGALSYSLQLYFDFSGYTDMALGLALLFGLRFPANFNSPYRAPSIIDFWQRWHMTLTRYLTLYLYSPMALWISRRRLAQGKAVSRKAISTPGGFLSLIATPTFFTIVLAGIWHGAGLRFVVYGLLHASYLTINHAWRSFGPRISETSPHPVAKAAAMVGKVALTYLAVVVSLVIFRAPSLHEAARVLKGMAGVYGFASPPSYDPAFTSTSLRMASFLSIMHIFILVVLYFIIWLMPNSLQLLDRYKPSLSDIRLESPISFQCAPNIIGAIALGLMAALALMEVTGMTEFLYFRF